MKVQPVHPRERLQRAFKQKTDKLKLLKWNICIQGKGCREHLEKKIPKISVDKEVLEDLPYLNTKIKVDETNKLSRKEVIFDQIINQLPPNNDTYYIKHDKKQDSFTVKKDVKRRPVLKRKYNLTAAVVNAVKKKYAKPDRRRKNN